MTASTPTGDMTTRAPHAATRSRASKDANGKAPPPTRPSRLRCGFRPAREIVAWARAGGAPRHESGSSTRGLKFPSCSPQARISTLSRDQGRRSDRGGPRPSVLTGVGESCKRAIGLSGVAPPSPHLQRSGHGPVVTPLGVTGSRVLACAPSCFVVVPAARSSLLLRHSGDPERKRRWALPATSRGRSFV